MISFICSILKLIIKFTVKESEIVVTRGWGIKEKERFFLNQLTTYII